MSRKPGNEPTEYLLEYDNALWRKQPQDEEWIDLGIAPRPKGIWQTFWYHIFHGLIMQYSLLSVIKFAWQHRDSFNENINV